RARPRARAPARTCSEYAITAVKQRGIAVGLGLAAWRILRCNPLGAGGYDPVPPRRAIRASRAAIAAVAESGGALVSSGVTGSRPRRRGAEHGRCGPPRRDLHPHRSGPPIAPQVNPAFKCMIFF